MSQRLKEISKSQVIMVVQPVSRLQVGGAHLRCLQAHDHVGRETVKEIRSKRQVTGKLSRRQTMVASILPAREEVERPAIRHRNRQLRPSALAVQRLDLLLRRDRKSLADSAGAQMRHVFTRV